MNAAQTTTAQAGSVRFLMSDLYVEALCVVCDDNSSPRKLRFGAEGATAGRPSGGSIARSRRRCSCDRLGGKPIAIRSLTS
jgi:hypothetical protein